MQQHIDQLANADLKRFADWPNHEIPDVCAGVYTIHEDDGTLIYTGMAGASLDERTAQQKRTAKKRSGLFDRDQ